MNPTIYFLCSDSNAPIGGHKVMYRHVDILNKNGISACIVHQEKGMRHAWFENRTRTTCVNEVRLFPEDIFVIPEAYGPKVAGLARGTKKVIFNQNAYYTFIGYSADTKNMTTPYTDTEVLAAIAVSEDTKQYLQFVFPNLKIFRVYNAIDPKIFTYQDEKKKKICFMPRKNSEDAVQVINILKFRGILKDFDIVAIEGMNERQVAYIMKESLIFLSFGYSEGSPLPPVEAMACGCIVVGYHGMGGKEFFMPDITFPVSTGDIISFAQTLEKVINHYDNDPQFIKEKGRLASLYINKYYSTVREENSVMETWRSILYLQNEKKK